MFCEKRAQAAARARFADSNLAFSRHGLRAKPTQAAARTRFAEPKPFKFAGPLAHGVLDPGYNLLHLTSSYFQLLIVFTNILHFLFPIVFTFLFLFPIVYCL